MISETLDIQICNIIQKNSTHSVCLNSTSSAFQARRFLAYRYVFTNQHLCIWISSPKYVPSVKRVSVSWNAKAPVACMDIAVGTFQTHGRQGILEGYGPPRVPTPMWDRKAGLCWIRSVEFRETPTFYSGQRPIKEFLRERVLWSGGHMRAEAALILKVWPIRGGAKLYPGGANICILG